MCFLTVQENRVDKNGNVTRRILILLERGRRTFEAELTAKRLRLRNPDLKQGQALHEITTSPQLLFSSFAVHSALKFRATDSRTGLASESKHLRFKEH